MQYSIFLFCLGTFYVVGLASLLLHLLREYRQHKAKQKDIYPAVGWQTAPLPIAMSVEQGPPRPLALLSVEEVDQTYEALRARAYARCLETLLATPGKSEDVRKGA